MLILPIQQYNELCKLIVIRNSISLICFTILAIIFKTWWIVFFAMLFTSYIDKEALGIDNNKTIN
mgnify:CR=1 FL=1